MGYKSLACLAIVPLVVATATAPARAAQPPPEPSTCVIERLPQGGGWTLSLVTGADPSGRYILGRGYPAQGLHRYVVMWDGAAKPTKVPMPGIDQVLADINASGVAVGFSFDPVTWDPLTPWIYSERKLRPLPGVESGLAVAINSSGQIVGERFGNPIWWPAGESGPVVDLPLPDGAISASVHDIDDDGSIVGSYAGADRVDHAAVWRPDGTVQKLPLPAGEGPASRAFSVRDGWAAGWAAQKNQTVAVRWNLRTGETRTFAEVDIASAVNGHGWIIGSSPDGRAVFASDTTSFKLPALSEHEPVALADIPETISGDGRVIAGQATDGDESIRAVRWVCH